MTNLEEIIEGLSDNIWTSLDLTSIDIGDEGAIALATALEDNISLTSLNLGWQKISPGKAILNDSSRGYQELSPEKAIALAIALDQNNNRSSRISSKGAIAIANALEKNTSLTSIGLQTNNIGLEGAKAIAKALEKNTTLTSLDLRYNQLHPDGIIDIVKALTNPKCSVTKIDIEDPFKEACDLAINLRVRAEKFTKFLLGRHKRLGSDSALQMLVDDMAVEISDILVTQFISEEWQKIKSDTANDIFKEAVKKAIAENTLFPASSVQNPIAQSLISQDRQITL